MADPTVSIPSELTNGSWPQSPNLFPNTGQGIAVAGNQMQLSDQADFLVRFPRVNATATATITGSISNLDSLTLNIVPGAGGSLSTPGGAQTVTITAATSDTVSNLVEKFINAIAANTVLAEAGIYGTGVLGVLTLHSPGPLGNFTAWTESVGTGSETITLSAATLTGGSGAIIPSQGFAFWYSGQMIEFRAGQPKVCDIGLLKVLAASGYPVY